MVTVKSVKVTAAFSNLSRKAWESTKLKFNDQLVFHSWLSPLRFRFFFHADSGWLLFLLTSSRTEYETTSVTRAALPS